MGHRWDQDQEQGTDCAEPPVRGPSFQRRRLCVDDLHIDGRSRVFAVRKSVTLQQLPSLRRWCCSRGRCGGCGGCGGGFDLVAAVTGHVLDDVWPLVGAAAAAGQLVDAVLRLGAFGLLAEVGEPFQLAAADDGIVCILNDIKWY